MLIPKPITDRAQRKRQRCQYGCGEPQMGLERVAGAGEAQSTTKRTNEAWRGFGRNWN